MATQYRIGKDSKGKVRLGKESVVEKASNQPATIWQPNISKDNISKDNISKVSISEDSISEYNSVKDNSCGQLGWLSCLELLGLLTNSYKFSQDYAEKTLVSKLSDLD